MGHWEGLGRSDEVLGGWGGAMGAGWGGAGQSDGVLGWAAGGSGEERWGTGWGWGRVMAC